MTLYIQEINMLKFKLSVISDYCSTCNDNLHFLMLTVI